MFSMLADRGLLDAELARRLRATVGFRNIAVHQYEAIDWRIAHAICKQCLGDFANFARAVVPAMGNK